MAERHRKAALEIVALLNEQGCRAIDTNFGGCTYFSSETGDMCAVGHALLHPELWAGEGEGFSNSGIEDEDLKPQYRGLGSDFWSDLQILHDRADYWEIKSNGKWGLKASAVASFLAHH